MGCGSSIVQSLPANINQDEDEYGQFQRYMQESKEQDIEIQRDNLNSTWRCTAQQNEFSNGFAMNVWQRVDPTGQNKNDELRGEAVFQGITPDDLTEFFTNPKNFPGLKDWVDVETLENGDEIKYYSIKMPLLKVRENVLKYRVERFVDGSIFLSIRSWNHPRYPLRSEAIRVRYTNKALFSPTMVTLPSGDQVSGCKLTEFIHMDLGGSVPTSVLNGALGKETIKANHKMMTQFMTEGRRKASEDAAKV